MTWLPCPSVWPWTSPLTSLFISARKCVFEGCVCVCVCTHVCACVHVRAQGDVTIHQMLWLEWAPWGKCITVSLPPPERFSHMRERCHFLITSLEYQLFARYSGTNCSVPPCDTIKKETPVGAPRQNPFRKGGLVHLGSCEQGVGKLAKEWS